MTNANLGDFAQAEQLLSQLVEVNRGDPDAWRLLGETRTALGRPGDAVAAFRAGRESSPEDIGLLKGVAGALVQDGRPEAAVRELQGEAERVRARAASGAAAAPGQRGIGAVEVDLLLAKVFSQWKGHTGDALAVYDRVIAENPDDFRCEFDPAPALGPVEPRVCGLTSVVDKLTRAQNGWGLNMAQHADVPDVTPVAVLHVCLGAQPCMNTAWGR